MFLPRSELTTAAYDAIVFKARTLVFTPYFLLFQYIVLPRIFYLNPLSFLFYLFLTRMQLFPTTPLPESLEERAALIELLRTESLLLIDKPLGWTSFDVVNKVRFALRRVTGDKGIKVGHAGTLDPLATGLLVIGTGKATKQLQTWQDEDKEYTGIIRLGQTTPSYDLETEPSYPPLPTDQLTRHDLQAAAARLTGAIAQMPPIFSAIKIAGQPAYKQARKGGDVTMQPRHITIHTFELTDTALPDVHFRVECSKGTYIRSLAYDFGAALGCGAHLAALVRTRSGGFSLRDAHTLTPLLDTLAALSTTKAPTIE